VFIHFCYIPNNNINNVLPSTHAGTETKLCVVFCAAKKQFRQHHLCWVWMLKRSKRRDTIVDTVVIAASLTSCTKCTTPTLTLGLGDDVDIKVYVRKDTIAVAVLLISKFGGKQNNFA
jgi:hypothetical protein